MRRVRVTLAAGVVLVALGGVTPAAAEPPESFNQLFESFPITVNGSYTPLVGGLFCSDGGDFAIIWYAPGSGADWRWQHLSFAGGSELHTSVPLTVNGTYEPFVGDFDGDGCDDVFWYAPGSAADYVWYGVDGGGFTSRTVTVNGDYTPMVGDWDGGAPGDDIFWYGSGGGTESIWRGSSTLGSFGLSTAPQVSGTDYLVSSGGDGVLFHRPGPGADYLWEGILAGATAPAASIPTTINRAYEPYFPGRYLLYGPGAAPDTLIYDYEGDGTLTTIPGTINGTYRVAVPAPTHFSGAMVFHAPGPAQDYFWLAGVGEGAAAFEKG